MDSKTPDNRSELEMAESGQSSLSETEGRDKTANLFARLWAATNMIKQMEKDGKKGKGLQYDYISHDLVSSTSKWALQQVGVYHYPTTKKFSQDGNRTTVMTENHFVNIDNPEDKISVDFGGHGVDNQDKGAGKAYSYAVKICLQKMFKMNTAEDIEAHNVDYDDGHSAKVTEAKEEAREAIEAWATTFKAALDSAPNLAAIKELEKSNKGRLTSAELPPVTRTFFVELIQKRKEDLT